MRISFIGLAATAVISTFQVTDAFAQYALPTQGASGRGSGALTVTPLLGWIHEDSFDQFNIAARGRYAVNNQISAGARLGFLLGDNDSFSFGVDGSYQILGASSDGLNVSAFTALDFTLGDLDTVAWAVGPMVGFDIKAGSLQIDPYAGASIGIFHRSISVGSDTDLLFALVGGANFQITPQFGAFVELSIGLTDSYPLFNLMFGVPFDIIGGQVRGQSAPAKSGGDGAGTGGTGGGDGGGDTTPVENTEATP